MISLYIECKTTWGLKIDGVAEAKLENRTSRFGIIGKMMINRVT